MLIQLCTEKICYIDFSADRIDERFKQSLIKHGFNPKTGIFIVISNTILKKKKQPIIQFF